MLSTARQPVNKLQSPETTGAAASAGVASGVKVLRDTYRLLSATLVFSAVIAGSSAMLKLPVPGLVITLVGYFGLLFITYKMRNSAWGLLSVFALTGFMGYTLGPLIGHYLAMSGGPQLVMTSMGITGIIFFSLSWYARQSSAINMANWGSFLMIGIITAFCLALAAVFFQMPALSLAVSGLFVLLMSGLIMFETQNILRGGETNYILATVSLFVAIFNLFTSLLHILGFMGGDE